MARIVRLAEGNENLALEEAVKALQEGKMIAYPTETSYGIGADALNEKAVEKVHEAKQQPKDKPISVIVADEKQAEKVAELDENARKLIHNFMPGPLTIVCRKGENVPDTLSRGSIAFRISGNKFARRLAEKFGGAITATSANLHGEPAIYSAKELKEKLGNKLDLIVDAGRLPHREASTIYNIINKRVIRRGAVSEEKILKVMRESRQCMET